MNETEYRQKFKIPLNGGLRRAFREKVEYRKKRRQLELSHQPFAGEPQHYGKSREPSREKGHRAEVEYHAGTAYPDEPVSSYRELPRAKGKNSADVPRLVLVSTPTPPKRRADELFDGPLSINTRTPRGDHDPIMIDVAVAAQTESLGDTDGLLFAPPVANKSTQTPLHLLSDLINESRQKNIDKLRRSRSFERTLRPDRRRSKSPFAPYGAGDRETTMAGKRTFNVKADAAEAFKYPSAVSAGRRRIHRDERQKKRKVKQRVDPPQRFPLTAYQENFGHH